MKRESAAELLDKYRGMIQKLAWQSWRRLPTSVKIWVSPEDMVADAYVAIISSLKRKRFDPRKASMSTIIWLGISNFFMNYAARHQTQKRFGWSVPIEDVLWLGQQDAEIRNREALDALSRVHKEASPECREQMARWFGQVPVRARRSAQQKKIYEEFQVLAHRARLTKQDCRELMRAGVCMR